MILMNCLNISENTLHTPLQLKMIAPIIANAVEETPGISYQMIREILSPFVNDYALTDNILQECPAEDSSGCFECDTSTNQG